ncbi:MAG: MATE family efflux transporter, partial [Parabacteroides sp.]|nr:MATE family efflux transporter [Parabacteroides sp.]
SAILCYLYMRRRFPILQAESAADLHFDKRLAKTLLAMGVPMGLQFSITAIGSIMLQSANNALGTACVAAFSAAVRIKMFFICPFESLGIAMATYCGQNYGAGKIDRILQGIKVSLAMMLTYAVVSATIVALGARPMSQLFVDASEMEVLDYAVYYLRVICCFYPVLGVLCILRYSIQGVGFSNFAMFSGVAEMIARASVSLWVVPAFAFSGVSFGDPMAWCCADLFLIPAFIHVYHKIKERIAHEKVSLSAV